MPNPTVATNLGLTLRTLNSGALVDALIINPSGSANFAGNVTAPGFFNTSDARLKENIRPLTGALAAVQGLRGVRYSYRHNLPGKTLPQGEQVGVLAQEVEKLYPELVATGADGYKAVNYAQLAPVLIEALKELKAENDALRGRAAILETAATQAAADHADLLTMKQQLARLLGEQPTAAQAPARR